MRGTEVTIPGVCVDGGKVFGKLRGCGAEFDGVSVDSVVDELAEPALLGLCKISVFQSSVADELAEPALLALCKIWVFQSSTADAWYVRLL